MGIRTGRVNQKREQPGSYLLDAQHSSLVFLEGPSLLAGGYPLLAILQITVA